MSKLKINNTILKYYKSVSEDSYHRYNSWENCYKYFRKRRFNKSKIITDLDCLQLGFFLASWGMYRGSGFLLGKSYEVHRSVIKELLDKKYKILWNLKIEELDKNSEELSLLFELSNCLKNIYIDEIKDDKNVSDTLITKVLLGTMCCTSAYDKYFKDGCYHQEIHPFSNFSKDSYLSIIEFYKNKEDKFKEVFKEILRLSKN